MDRCGSQNGYQKTSVHKRLDYVLKIRQPLWVQKVNIFGKAYLMSMGNLRFDDEEDIQVSTKKCQKIVIASIWN